MKFVRLVKGKLFVAVLTGVVLIGGAPAAFAACPAGKGVVHKEQGVARLRSSPIMANSTLTYK